VSTPAERIADRPLRAILSGEVTGIPGTAGPVPPIGDEPRPVTDRLSGVLHEFDCLCDCVMIPGEIPAAAEDLNDMSAAAYAVDECFAW
jgi:hypothetical protein